MAAKPKNAFEPAPAPRRRSRLTVALLAATAIVIGVTIYVSVRPPWDRDVHRPAEPSLSQAQRTRLAIDEILARADAIGPEAGKDAMLRRREAYETARELGRKFIHLSDPRDILVRPALARAELRLGRMEEAERTVDALLRLSPRSAEGLWLKGEILAAQGGDALAFFRQAAENDQAGPEIWARYGLALLRAGDKEGAEKFLSRAEQGGRGDSQTLLALAGLAMDRNDFVRTEALLQRIVGTGRARLHVLAMLAEAQIQAGKLAEAEQTLHGTLAGSDEPGLRLRLADVVWLRGRRQEAADLYAKVAEDPLHEALASFKAARCYYLLDRYALAMKYIDRAAEHAATGEVLEWRRKIEDARFGPSTTTAPAGPLTPMDGLRQTEGTPRGEPPPAATRPAWLPR